MVEYTESVGGVAPGHLYGFFVGWRVVPPPEQHLAILRGTDHVVLARDGERVGTELMRRMLARLDSLPVVDLSCDADLEPFYRRFDLVVLDRAMGFRR